MTKSYSQAIKDFGKLPEKVVRGTVLSMGAKIIQRTPVGNPALWKRPVKGYVGGRLRNNWQFTFGQPATGTEEGVDPSGSKATAELRATAGRLKMGQVFYMTNNLPYATRIEFGHSKQAPQGMVRVTVAEHEVSIREAAAKA